MISSHGLKYVAFSRCLYLWAHNHLRECLLACAATVHVSLAWCRAPHAWQRTKFSPGRPNVALRVQIPDESHRPVLLISPREDFREWTYELDSSCRVFQNIFFSPFSFCILGVFLFARLIYFPLPVSDPTKYACISPSPRRRLQELAFSAWNCGATAAFYFKCWTNKSHLTWVFCKPECVCCWKASAKISKTILRQN